MKKILYLLTLLMTISFGSYGQQLKQIQKGTDKNQIPVTNGKQNTQVYRDAVPYILDTLHLRDSLAGIKGSGIPTRVAYWAAVDSLGHDPQLVWDTITKGLTVNTFKVWRGANNVGTNLGIGKETLQNATGINNFAIGDNALKNNTTGVANVAIGKEALKSNTTGGYNLAIGNDALKNATTASNNVGIGVGSLTNATTGYNNVGLGVNTLSSLTTGYLNIGIGGNSLYNATTGTYNMAIGYSSLNLNQTGRYNVAIGAFSLLKNNSVGFNVAIGSNAGYNNTSGTSNVFIGNEAGYNETGSNTLYIDNSNTSSPLIGGNFSSNRVGINKAISGINTTLHVGGNATIDDISGTATKIAGFDSNNKVVEATIGTGLDLTSGVLSATALPTPDSTKVVGQWAIQVNESPKQQFNLKVDSSKVATKYDLTQISGGVTNVTATAPITSSGGATPNISISQSGASANGYLSSTDWNTFNNKVGGSGTATRVAFWNSGSTLSSNSNLYWDNTNSRLGVGLISNLDAWLNIQGMAGIGSEKAIAFRNSGDWVSSWIKTFNNASPQQRGISFGGRRHDGAENNDILVINGFSSYPSVGINTPYPLADLHVTTPFYSGTVNGIRLDHSSSIQSVRQINDEGDIILRSTTGHMSVGKLSTWTNDLNPSVTLHLFGDGGNTSDGLFRLEKPGGWGYTQLNQYAQASPFARGIKIYHDTGGTPVIVTNSNGNRVGINKEAPDAQLHVGGTMIVDNPTGTATKLTGLTSANQLTTLTIGTGLDLTSGVLSNTVTVPLTWAAVGNDVCSWASTEAFNSGKKIGISTCSPSRQLDVLGDVRFRGAIYSSTNSAGTAGQVLTSNGTGAWYWSTPSAGMVNLAFDPKSGTDVYMYPSGGGSGVTFRDGDGTTVNRVSSNVIKIDNKSPETTVYSSAGSYTWTKPTGCKTIYVRVVGAGGGGAGGSKGTSSTFVAGGGGGQGGGYSEYWFQASDVVTNVSITVGAGGNGGAGATANNGSGSNGTKGGDSSFGGAYIKSIGGAGGLAINEQALQGEGSVEDGARGGYWSSGGTSSNAVSSKIGAGGGGFGGAINNGTVQAFGINSSRKLITIYGAGSVGGGPGGIGGAASNSGNGTAGANAVNGISTYGGGGGGGGAALNSVGNGGAGGKGGDGAILVIAYF